MTFRLTITAAETLLFDGKVTYCSVFTESGKLGLEPRHEPLLAVLKKNSQVYFKDEAGNGNQFTIESGLLSFRDNICILTVSVSSQKRE